MFLSLLHLLLRVATGDLRSNLWSSATLEHGLAVATHQSFNLDTEMLEQEILEPCLTISVHREDALILRRCH